MLKGSAECKCEYVLDPSQQFIEKAAENEIAQGDEIVGFILFEVPSLSQPIVARPGNVFVFVFQDYTGKPGKATYIMGEKESEDVPFLRGITVRPLR